MPLHPEVDVHHFTSLMQRYLQGKLSARQYQQEFFAAMKLRCTLADDVVEIVNHAYGDADDYDPEIRLPHTIEEPELRARVRNSLSQLAALGID